MIPSPLWGEGGARDAQHRGRVRGSAVLSVATHGGEAEPLIRRCAPPSPRREEGI